MQKIRHLVKSALLVAPDGYILDIHGPCCSNDRNNDANLLFNINGANQILAENYGPSEWNEWSC